MTISIKLQDMVRIDNEGAIFIARCITTTSHTKHMDIRYKYVHEYIESIVIKIVFVKSADNDNSIITKNLSAEHHEKHSKKMVGEKVKDVLEN